MKRWFALMQRVVLMLWTGALSCGTASHAEPVIKPILQRQVEHFTTGLRPYGEMTIWVDNDRLLVNALEEGLKEEYKNQYEDKRRLVLVDYAKRQLKTLIHGVRLLNYDRATRVILVDVIHDMEEDTQGACPPSRYCDDVREVSLTADGKTFELNRWPRGKKLDYREIMPRGAGRKALNNGKDGFLSEKVEAETDSQRTEQYMQQIQRLWKFDEGIPTVWIRKDQPPQPISVRYDEINGNGWYLEFMNRYLLVDSDTSGSSSTNSHMATSAWKRPYEFTPFYLLAPDGSVESIPYPDFIFDYGIADRHSDFWHGRNFGYLLPTRAGMLITTIRAKDSAMYLYSDGQLYQIAGHSPHFRMKPSGAALPLALSPDGCKLAYRHTDRDSIEHLISAGGYVPPVVTIIDICGGK